MPWLAKKQIMVRLNYIKTISCILLLIVSFIAFSNLVDSNTIVLYNLVHTKYAPIAQLDRASDFGSEGRGFESFWARQQKDAFYRMHLFAQN